MAYNWIIRKDVNDVRGIVVKEDSKYTDQVFRDLPLLPPHLMHLCFITVSSGVLAPKAQPSCPALLSCQECV